MNFKKRIFPGDTISIQLANSKVKGTVSFIRKINLATNSLTLNGVFLYTGVHQERYNIGFIEDKHEEYKTYIVNINLENVKPCKILLIEKM